MDRLTSLSVFGKVVESGGFSAAARRLNMSVTMVANHVQSLEDRLGVRLLNRTTRKVSLTETGKYYYERSTQILAELEEIDHTAGALTSTPRGMLKIYSNTAMVRFLTPIIDEYMTLYPSVILDFAIGERMVDMVEDGYDLAIRAILPDANLIVRKLVPWRHIAVASPSYLEKHQPITRPQDLVQHNCLRYAHYVNGDSWRFEGRDGEEHLVKVSGTMVSNSVDLLIQSAKAGHGIFLAPIFSAYDELEIGSLVRVMPDYRGAEFSIDAIFPNRNHLPTKVRLFIELLAERFQPHRKWMS